MATTTTGHHIEIRKLKLNSSNDCLKKFWETENLLDSIITKKTNEHRACIKHFEYTYE